MLMMLWSPSMLIISLQLEADAHVQEETAQMDQEMEQYGAELAQHGGWPASRDDTIYL